MGRAKSDNRKRETYEWSPGVIANIGTTATFPYDIIFHYIKDKNLESLVNIFFDNDTRKINYLDLCVLEQFWWVKSDLIGARYSKIEHPLHFVGEYIFDTANGYRTILEVRQPDIDGMHWKASHIHIKRGAIDLDNENKIVKPNFNQHIELSGEQIQGVYVMKIF